MGAAATRDAAVAALLLAIAAAAAYESARLPFGTVREPGPGFFPWWTSLGTAGVALVLLARALAPRPGGGAGDAAAGAGAGPTGRWDAAARVGGLLAVLGAYVVLLEPAGYPLCTFLLALFMLRVTERVPWLAALGASAAIAVGTYVVFALWLRVPLPPGVLAR